MCETLLCLRKVEEVLIRAAQSYNCAEWNKWSDVFSQHLRETLQTVWSYHRTRCTGMEKVLPSSGVMTELAFPGGMHHLLVEGRTSASFWKHQLKHWAVRRGLLSGNKLRDLQISNQACQTTLSARQLNKQVGGHCRGKRTWHAQKRRKEEVGLRKCLLESKKRRQRQIWPAAHTSDNRVPPTDLDIQGCCDNWDRLP